MKKLLMTAALISAAVGGLGASAAPIQAVAAPGYHLLYDDSYSLPYATAGTACPSPWMLRRTTWNTVLICNQYVTSTGAPALHWTYEKLNPADYSICLTDGYMILGETISYAPTVCHTIPVAPRLPWSMAS